MGRDFLHQSRPAPGRGVNHPPLSSSEVKERVELYLYFPAGLLWRNEPYRYIHLHFLLLYSETPYTLLTITSLFLSPSYRSVFSISRHFSYLSYSFHLLNSFTYIRFFRIFSPYIYEPLHILPLLFYPSYFSSYFLDTRLFSSPCRTLSLRLLFLRLTIL